MKLLISSSLLILMLPLDIQSQEWPVYSPSTILSERDTANANDAEIPLNSIIINDRHDCNSGCSWTVEMISRRRFRIWNNDLPLEEEIGHAKRDLEFQSGVLKLKPRYKLSWFGRWIFSNNKPEPGDKFYITVTSNGEQAGKLSGGYCDYTSAVPVWHNYHSGIDIGDVENLVPPTPTGAPGDPTPIPGTVCHIYPVRDGEIVAVKMLTGGDKAVIVKTSTDIYDWYGHVQHDVFDVKDYTSNPIQVMASGPFATRLSSLVNHDYPHLHFDVCNDADGDLPTTKSIKNPLNNLVPYDEPSVPPPAVIERQNVPGICFRADDHGLPTPLPTPFTLSAIRGNVDIEAQMLQSIATKPMGINQIEYYLFAGFGAEQRFQESRVFMNQSVLCGEPGQNEYSPYHFTEYGMNSVPVSTLYGRGPFPSVMLHNFYYILTNNQDMSGGKAGFSTSGSWNTGQTVLTPAGNAKKYPDGLYTVLVRGADIHGNRSDDSNPGNSRSITVLNTYNHVLYVGNSSQLPDDPPGPFASITSAMTFSSSGTLVIVAPGMYNSSCETFPIDIPEGVTLMGSGHERTFVHGNGATAVFRCTHNNAVLSGFTISGGGNNPDQANVVIDNASVKVRDCRISGNGTTGTGVVFFWSTPGARAENCIIENHTSVGIGCDHSNHAHIVNCTIINNAGAGIYGAFSAWATIANCILRSHDYALAVEYNSHFDVHRSIFWQNTYDYAIAPGSTIDLFDCYQADPLFVTAHGRSYYLDYSSSCVDLGRDYLVENAQIYLKTTREDNYCDPGTGLYDLNSVDVGFHYEPIIPTPTPYPTHVSTHTPPPTNTPTLSPTPVSGLGVVYLDSPEYFTEGDTAEILVRDADLNTNPSLAESYEVNVTSSTIFPSAVPMTVMEVSVDSAYFTTCASGTDLGFTMGSSTPYEAVQVSDGDSVTVVYDDVSPGGQRADTSVWYSAVPPTETPFPTSVPTMAPTVTETPTTTPTAHQGAYHEDFESGASGWVTTGLWHLTTRDSHSSTHAMWYADGDLEHYDTGSPNSGTLTSPPIQLEAGYTTLTIWSREQTDGTRYWDTRKVWISNDSGASWDLLLQSYNNDDSWYQPLAVNLANYAGDTIKIRFEFDTVDDGDNQHKGWLIDDVAIDDSPLPIPALGLAGKLVLLIMFFVLMITHGRRGQSSGKS